jgi:RNA polymerase-interacting CarD/CdnL/TRCF family regulator
MAKDEVAFYEPGDWIVHLHHGVGEIESIEKRELGGSTTTYYKVVTNNSTLWVPLDKAENRWFRPLATRDEFDQVFAILQRPPRKMHSNHNTRKKRINTVKSEGSLQETARIIRDLWARRVEKSRLNNTEERALRRFTDRFLREWAVSMDMDEEEAREEMQSMLQKSLDKTKEQEPAAP